MPTGTAKPKKIIDWKVYRTGYIYMQRWSFYYVKWHNGITEKLSLRDVKRKRYENKPRYEIL